MHLTAEEQQAIEALAEKARYYNAQREANLQSKREREERDRQAYIRAHRNRAQNSALLAWGRRGR